MTSKISKILADSEKHKNNKVINRNVAELWNRYKNFKAKFHAHNAKLEQFTLKVLKLSFFSNQHLKTSNNLKNKRKKSCKTNIKCQYALIKKAISIHLRSLQIEQRLFEENQFLKELLGHSYKIVIKEKNTPATEIYEIKKAKAEEKCFKRGLEYIFHELEDITFKRKSILEAGNGIESTPRYINNNSVTGIAKCLQNLPYENAKLTGVSTGKKLNSIPEVVDSTDIDTEKSQNFNLQIDFHTSNSLFDLTADIPHMVNINLNSILQNISNQSLNTLVLDVKPLRDNEALFDIKDTVDKKRIVQKTQVATAKVQSIKRGNDIKIDMRKKAGTKCLKNISTLIPNNIILNYIGLFFPISFLLREAIFYHDTADRKKYENLILQKESTTCVDYQRKATNTKSAEKDVILENANLVCSGPEGDISNVSRDERDFSEVKTVEFYDIPSNTDIHDYTVSWVEQQNEREFYYIKQPEKMENHPNTTDQLTRRKSIMKKSTQSSRQNDFKDYLKDIITYSEEFFNKRDSTSTINPLKVKKRSRVINFPSSSSIESNYPEKYKNKTVLEHNSSYYKVPKMPDMNKTYQIVFQQNMSQGFSLKFVKSKEQDISTLIVSNRYPMSNPSFPKTKFYKT